MILTGCEGSMVEIWEFVPAIRIEARRHAYGTA
jgi:hypothetical protein